MNKDILELIENKLRVEEKQATKFLTNELTRSFFINNYSFFLEDDNLLFYQKYIEDSLNRKLSYLEKSDIIDLCLAIHFFSEKIYNYIQKKLLEREHYIFKLSGLDYLNNFYFNELIKSNYIKINYDINKKTTNSLIKFQTNLNLFLTEDTRYVKKVQNVLRKEDTIPFFFYRFINTLSFPQFENYRNLIDLKSAINNSKLISKANKKDLFTTLKKYL